MATNRFLEPNAEHAFRGADQRHQVSSVATIYAHQAHHFTGGDTRSPLVRASLPWLGIDLSPWVALLLGLAVDTAHDVTNFLRTAVQVQRHHLERVRQSVGGYSKRLLDLAVAVPALILLSPLMAVVAASVVATIGRPAIYAHSRIGLNARPFDCYKFRTMVSNGDEILRAHLASDPQAAREWAETRKLRNDPRVTPIGQFLRKSSLDELPQLINVLRGEMSLIGPRPIVAAELPRYGRQARHYLRARPGISGLWQVSGRSSTSYRRRVAMDTLYVRKWSLSRDIAIGLLTIPAVLRTKDTV